MVSLEQPGHVSTEELFRRHATFVARFLLRLGVPAPQLEDAVQQVFLVVHRQGGYRPGLAQPTSYLASIAIQAAAQQRRRRRSESKVLADAPLEHVASSSPDPAQALHVQQELQRLQQALERVPEELRTTLLLVDVEGESCVSVAAALGSPVGTIYWRLHQARQKLQAALVAVDASAARSGRQAGAGRSLLVALVPAGFGGSEAGQLLQLSRGQFLVPLSLEDWLVRHQQLVRAPVELPAWVASSVGQPASWGSVLGVGPLAASGALVALVATALLDLAVIAPARHPPVAAAATARAQVAAVPGTQTLLLPEPADIPIGAVAAPAVSEPGDQVGTRREAAGRKGGKRSRRELGADGDRAELGEAALAEMREVALAERLLTSDPERALSLARELPRRFPNGYFGEERAYLEVMALSQLGRFGEMRSSARAYLRAFPVGLYAERVRRALASAGG